MEILMDVLTVIFYVLVIGALAFATNGAIRYIIQERKDNRNRKKYK